MPKKKKSVYTRLYELAFSFNGRAQQFFYHVEEKDRQRLLHVFGDCEEHLFHELGGHEGIERLVNSAHIRLNILDYLGGIEFEAEPKLTDRQWQKKIEEREDSDESVILRIWLKGEEKPIVHYDIQHAAWSLTQTCLVGGEKFIQFRDEDGEEVLYGTDHIDAIEMIDPFYLNEEQVGKFLSRYDDDDDNPEDVPGSSGRGIDAHPSVP
jgi:hypothetical protein